MKAAIETVKKYDPKKIIVAVPVGPPEIIKELKLIVDDVICIYQPSPFHAVGLWYSQFSQVKDDEVHKYLDSAFNYRIINLYIYIKKKRQLLFIIEHYY